MKHESLSILLADDEAIVHKTIGDFLQQCGHRVQHVHDGAEVLQRLSASHEFDLLLVDVRMPVMDGMAVLQSVRETSPDLPVVLITAHGCFDLAIQALRDGAADFLTKPVRLLELEAVLMKTSRVRALQLEQRRLRETIRGLQEANVQRAGGGSMLGESAATRRVREQILQVVEAGLDSVLLIGETGTGKEVAAREIHTLAGVDQSRPFIAVSCPALPDSLVESELFGHVKGSFTGAISDRAGYFEMADGGTLFLDEVADLSPLTQASLLRVLETRTLRRVGGTREIQVSIRVIAASNVDLAELVEKGRFRRDLYYRLNMFSIHLVPLRERRQDIVPLAHHFLHRFVSSKALVLEGFSVSALQLLENYEYPGNVRELRNIVERAAVLCRNGTIKAEHLHLPCSRTERQQQSSFEGDEHTRLARTLEAVKWNRRAAAKKLGIPYSTLRFRMQKMGIK